MKFTSAVTMLHRDGVSSYRHDEGTCTELSGCIDHAPKSSHACLAHFIKAELYGRMQEYRGVSGPMMEALQSQEFRSKIEALGCMGLKKINEGINTTQDVKNLQMAGAKAFKSVDEALEAAIELENKYPCMTPRSDGAAATDTSGTGSSFEEEYVDSSDAQDSSENEVPANYCKSTPTLDYAQNHLICLEG